MSYHTDREALEHRLLDAIAAWRREGRELDEHEFDALARDVCAFQCRYNEPYGRYARTLGVDAAHPPASWRDIPAVPSAAFKEATLTTFEPARAELHFVTSGTTSGAGGNHYLETATLYRASLLAGFERAMLADGARLRYLNLVPDPRERSTSSLGYMMATVAAEFGDGHDGWYLRDDGLDVDGFIAALERCGRENVAACIAGTAFAFVALLDALEERGISVKAPAGSRVMETGGFKGRTRVVGRDELYDSLAQRLSVPADVIVAEYGMTELCSQYYDAASSRRLATRIKIAPPWLRPLVVDASGHEAQHGEPGAIRHIDLANLTSVCAIETEDVGYRSGAGIVLLGRPVDAPARGCSLDAEDLRVAR